MPEGAYELGVDIGTSSVVAAICRSDPRCDSSSPVTFREDLTTVLAAWSAGRDLDESVRVDLIASPWGLLERVGDATPVRVGDRSAAAADVVAGLVRLLVDRATAHEGRAPSRTAVVVPPSWGGHRRAAFVAALGAVGLEDALPVSAAVAAVRAHVDSGELSLTATAVVVDLGAATCDVAVVGPRVDGELDHRAAPPAGLRWGGRDVDDAVLRHVRRCLELPADLSGQADRARAAALRAACRAAKEAASLETEVAVAVDPAWSDAAVRLTREELEVAVADDVERLVATTVDAIASAGMTADELTAVVLTGGASRMPLVAERLSDALAVPMCAAADPSVTAALGAARMATDLRATAEDTAGGTAEATAEAAPMVRRRAGRKRDERPSGRPGAPSRTSGRARHTAPGGRTGRPPAGRVAAVAALFLFLVVGPSVALALVGAGPGVVTDGTATAGDQAASTPATGQNGTSTAPDAAVDGAAATSNAGHQVDVPSTSRALSHSSSSPTTTAKAGSAGAATRPAAGPTVRAASSPASVPASVPVPAPAPITETTTDTTTPAPIIDTTAPPPTTTEAPPPTTTEAPPPTTSDTSTPPANSDTSTPPASSDTPSTDPAPPVAPVVQPTTDPTGATA